MTSSMTITIRRDTDIDADKNAEIYVNKQSLSSFTPDLPIVYD